MRAIGRFLLVLWALMALPAIAVAANQCVVPSSIPPGRAVFPPPGNKVIAPLTGHILALSWSPQFCKQNGKEEENADQCARGQKFGFILHGLWADGEGRNNPEWCKRVPAVPVEVMKQSYCATPSPGLMQHEWAKHGSCIATDPAAYFRAATLLYNALKWPDMNALSRSQLDVGAFSAAFAAANPGIRADMIRVQITPLGWLDEVKLCLDKTYHPQTCPGDIGGAGDRAKVKIWRTG